MFHISIKSLGILLFNILWIIGNAQYLEIDSINNISNATGDDLHPSWSSDGTKLVFQSDRNGNWDIYQYDLERDTVLQLTNTSVNEQHPLWLSKHSRMTYTSEKTGVEQIYIFDLLTGVEEPVIKRNIYTKAASFPVSEYLFYLLGYDELAREWWLYRYEFKYNSLKQIYLLSNDDHLPKVSADSELILFVSNNTEKSVDQLNIINWYGNIEQEFSDYDFADPDWYPDGLRIIFVSKMDNQDGEIYTIWKDGSHLERWTNDTLVVKNPVVSPTGKHLAVSVLLDRGYDLFLIPLKDY